MTIKPFTPRMKSKPQIRSRLKVQALHINALKDSNPSNTTAHNIPENPTPKLTHKRIHSHSAKPQPYNLMQNVIASPFVNKSA